jgi:hypothetical protein
MNRYDIINDLIIKYNYKTYLEIGVRNPDECFNLINCETKHSVDHGYEVELPHLNIENKVTYQYTSDNFFKLLENKGLDISTTYKWDIIFIDGEAHGWNGTVWKSIYKLRATRPDLFVCTVNTDYGIGIVKRGQQKCCDFDNSYYEYRIFEQNRKEHLNLVSIKEYREIFEL